MLFRKKIDRYCTYCQFAGKIDDETMVCQFCGIVPSDHRCRRFRYDPLRRIPGRPAAQAHPRRRRFFAVSLADSDAPSRFTVGADDSVRPVCPPAPTNCAPTEKILTDFLHFFLQTGCKEVRSHVQ